MKWIAGIFFLPIFALAQGQNVDISSFYGVSGYLQAYASIEGENPVSVKRVHDFLGQLDEKKEKFKNEKAFLEHVFLKTHQRLLKNYKEKATFKDLLVNGNYNCLTASALYALILEHFHFNYKIIETNYHIFLLAETSNGTILLESTDPLQGFVFKKQEIEKRIVQYRQNLQTESNKNKTYYRYNTSLYNTIDLNNLHGLLYYNLAVEAFNNQDLFSAVDYFEKACLFYKSQRITEFSKIITLALLESAIKTDIRERLLRRIQSIESHQLPVVASLKNF